MKQEYTLQDIADMAQVSRGTVDRVIHGRGKVSKDTYKKIRYVLDKISYKPNMIARSLRKGVLFKIAVLMPDYNYEIYWKPAVKGVEDAKNEYSIFGIKIDTFLFNPNKFQSFRQMYISILDKNYSAVLVAPFFFRESLDFFKKCIEIGLPVFTFNAQLDNECIVSHVGQDLISSGQTVASLLYKIFGKTAEFLIVHIKENVENSKHMQEKEQGFRNFCVSVGMPKKSVHVQNINNIKDLNKQLLSYLSDHPQIKGICVSTSKVWMVAETLHNHSEKPLLVGYDLLEPNVKYLRSGQIDILIYQNPYQQSSLSISNIIDYLMVDKKVQKKYLLPIEIVIKENLDTFLG